MADTPCIDLPGKGGTIVGHMFERAPGYRPVRSMNARLAERVILGDGQPLMTNVWGSYVAVIENSQRHTVSVLCDPSGALPCYYAVCGDLTWFASDLDLLRRSGWHAPRIDWMTMAGQLAAPGLAMRATCLEGLCELAGADRITFTADGPVRSSCWSPWDHVGRIGRSGQDLADELRQTVIACVAAWAGAFPYPLVGVSGGLDSSVIAAALTARQLPFLGFTLATADALGDERRYARALADALQFELSEHLHSHAHIDLTVSASSGRPNPGMAAYGQSNLLAQMELAAGRHCGAFFSGGGGDSVFCLLQSATPFTDRLQVEGLSPRTLETLWDICQLTGGSVFDVARMGARSWAERGSAYAWPLNTSFLNAEWVEAVKPRLTHDWLRAPGRAPKGKAVHIARLISHQIDCDLFPRDRFGPLLFPLLSQPIVELCLGIATWQWCAGGRNRAVVRRAFAGLLPDLVIERRWKGGPDNFACQVVERNKPRLREHLLDGVLTEAGVLDTQELEAALSDRRLVAGKDHLRLSALAEAEAWARGWVDTRS